MVIPQIAAEALVSLTQLCDVTLYVPGDELRFIEYWAPLLSCARVTTQVCCPVA